MENKRQKNLGHYGIILTTQNQAYATGDADVILTRREKETVTIQIIPNCMQLTLACYYILQKDFLYSNINTNNQSEFTIPGPLY